MKHKTQSFQKLPRLESAIGAVSLAITLGCMLLLQTTAYGQSGNHVFEGAEATNYGSLDLATPVDQSWSTSRGATPGYFSAVGTASYTSPADADANIDGYVKHYADAANQAFSFPVGTGADYRELSVSGTRTATAELGVAWIVGDPTSTADPTAPNAGNHAVTSFGTGITAVSTTGQWDWQDLSSDAVGSTVTVSIPDVTAFAAAPNLRLVGWDGTEWVNLSGTTGASANTEDNTLSGTMISGITAIGIGAGESPIDYSDGTAFTTVYAAYADANNDGTPDGTGSVWLGTSVSSDFVDASNAAATGDASGDDGFVMPPITGATLDHTVTLSAADATTVFYSVRMVYSGTNAGSASSGTIDLTGSYIFAAAGSQTITLSPAALDGFQGTIDYRVVAASSASDAAAAITGTSFTNGEVEDYQRIYTSPLPVDLLSFSADWQGSNAVITWETASELNSSHFDVERSFDGSGFEYIGTVGSKATGGNSNARLVYTYTDLGVKARTTKNVYYRLIQTDFDGASEVFGPAPLRVNRTTETSIALFPVPAQNEVTVQTTGLDEGVNYTLRVIGNLGNTVQESTFLSGRSYNKTILDISSLPSGVYRVTVEGGNLQGEVEKFIKID